MVKQHSSLSRCSTRMVKGLHRFTLEKYSLCKGIGHGKTIDSNAFTVGGHQWAVSIFPDGTTPTSSIYGDDWSVDVGFYVTLVSETTSEEDGARCLFQFTLLDQSGKGNHWRSTSLFDNVPGTGPFVLPTGKRFGYPSFIRRGQLDRSSYLKDDCLKIECVIGVVLPPSGTTDEEILTSPRCDDVGADFLTLLGTGEGSDVVFDVRGERFRAHKIMLSARSSVFESMFTTDHHHQQQKEIVVITNTEPRVFEALLHFIYSDTLPGDKRSLVMDGYAFGPSVSGTFGAKLLSAADEYDVVRLKTICESHIWRTISLGRFAEIMLIADRCNASLLKRLCFKYAADNYADLVELDSFNYLRKNCPLLLNEIDDYISKARHSTNEIKKQGSTAKQKLSIVDDCC